MAGYNWVGSAPGHPVPFNAVPGGRDADGSIIYIGRAYFQGDQLPCKVIPQRRVAYVSYNSREHAVHNYEILCQQKFEWVHNSGGHIPPGAVPGGRTRTGETLYVGRIRHGTAETVGKVHPSHGCLYIPYGGQELSYKNYEILTFR